MKYDIGAPRYSFAQKMAMAIAAAAVAWAGWAAVHDPYYGDFDFPDTLDLAIWRVEVAVTGVADSAENSIEETNESMQNTVDGRNRLNDRRVKRDTQ